MSATILPFTGVRYERQAAAPGRDWARGPVAKAEAETPRFAPGEAVEIHSYDWVRGDEYFAATVIRQDGVWVACRVPGHGDFSVHASRIERAAAEVA